MAAVDPRSPIPRYYQVYTSLRGLIRAGELRAGDALPSERQLVADYGVSRITIVKALGMLEQEGLIDRQHGRGNFVTNRLIDIDEPDRLKIAVFFPYAIHPSPLFDGILEGISGHEIQLQIVGYYNPDKEPWYVQDALDRGCDGFLFYPARWFPNEGMYRNLIEQDIPFVMVDRHLPQLETDYVIHDDYRAGYELTEFLIQQGQRRIAVLSSHEVSVTSVQERLRGYRQALEDNDLQYDEDLVWLDIYKELDASPGSVQKLKSAYQKLQERIERSRPTVVIAINRIVQEQIVQDLSTIRHKNDADFSIDVAAFTNEMPRDGDDFSIALALQSDEMLGETAVKLLIDRINGEISDTAVSRKLPMEIVDLKAIQQGAGIVPQLPLPVPSGNKEGGFMRG